MNQIKINCFQTVLRTVSVELNIPGKKLSKLVAIVSVLTKSSLIKMYLYQVIWSYKDKISY